MRLRKFPVVVLMLMLAAALRAQTTRPPQPKYSVADPGATGVPWRTSLGSSRPATAADLFGLGMARLVDMPAVGPPCTSIVGINCTPQADGAGNVLIKNLTANSIRPSSGNTIVILGDSIETLGSSDNTWEDAVWPNYAIVMSRGNIQLAHNAGVGGNMCSQMLSRFSTDVIAYHPKRVIIKCGTNDLGGAIPTSTTLATISSMISLAQANGIQPILATIPPRTAASGYQPGVRAINAGVLSLAASNNLEVIDFYSALVDPATGEYQVGWTSDGVHPTSIGARVMAETANGILAYDFPDTSQYLPVEASDGPNLVPNATFTTTSGGLPTSWTLVATVGTLGTVSVYHDGAITGNWLQIVNTTGNTSQAALATAITTGFAAGDTVLFVGRIQTRGLEGSGGSVSISAHFFPSGILMDLHGWTVNIDGSWALTGTVPAGTTSINVYANIGGSGTLKVGQVGFVDTTQNAAYLGRVNSPRQYSAGRYELPAWLRTVPPSPARPAEFLFANGLATTGLLSYWDMWGAASGLTSIWDTWSTGPSLTLGASAAAPTLNGAYAALASVQYFYADAPQLVLNGDWSVLFCGKTDGTTGIIVGVATSAANVNYQSLTYSSGAQAYIDSRNGGTQLGSGNLNITNAGYTALLLQSSAVAGTVTLKRMDTGVTVSVASTQPTGTVRMGIGVSARASNYGIVDSLKVLSVMVWARVINTTEAQSTYQALKALWTARGYPLM